MPYVQKRVCLCAVRVLIGLEFIADLNARTPITLIAGLRIPCVELTSEEKRRRRKEFARVWGWHHEIDIAARLLRRSNGGGPLVRIWICLEQDLMPTWLRLARPQRAIDQR